MAPDQRRAFSNEVIIGRVINGTPGEKAGIRVGDVVLKMNGVGLSSWKHFISEVSARQPGETVVLTIRRRGSRYMEIKGQRVERPADLQKLFRELKDGEEFTGRFVNKDKILDLSVVLGERK